VETGKISGEIFSKSFFENFLGAEKNFEKILHEFTELFLLRGHMAHKIILLRGQGGSRIIFAEGVYPSRLFSGRVPHNSQCLVTPEPADFAKGFCGPSRQGRGCDEKILVRGSGGQEIFLLRGWRVARIFRTTPRWGSISTRKYIKSVLSFIR
jgi:hypothetical protein